MGTDPPRATDQPGYGHEPVLDGLVPRLVGLKRRPVDLKRRPVGPPRRYERRVRLEYRTARPVVHLVGGRASGKTRLLDTVRAGYAGRVPLARADLGSEHLGEPDLADVTRLDAPNASPVTHLLYLLSYQLGLAVDWSLRRVRFPRLSAGLVVITAYRPDPPGAESAGGPTGGGDGGPIAPKDFPAFKDQLRAALVAAGDQDRKRLREAGSTSLSALEGVIGALLPGQQPAVEAAFVIARKQLLAPRANSTALRWWGRQFQQRVMFQGDPLERLFAFARYFRQGGVRRRDAEELLVLALLADIASHYGPLSRLNRLPPPLLLLDNLHHTPLGTEFLDLLLAGYAAGPDQVRPVVVGTSLGSATAEGLHGFPDVAKATPWRPTTSGGPAAWQLRLGMPTMQQIPAGRMLTGAGD